MIPRVVFHWAYWLHHAMGIDLALMFWRFVLGGGEHYGWRTVAAIVVGVIVVHQTGRSVAALHQKP